MIPPLVRFTLPLHFANPRFIPLQRQPSHRPEGLLKARLTLHVSLKLIISPLAYLVHPRPPRHGQNCRQRISLPYLTIPDINLPAVPSMSPIRPRAPSNGLTRPTPPPTPHRVRPLQGQYGLQLHKQKIPATTVARIFFSSLLL